MTRSSEDFMPMDLRKLASLEVLAGFPEVAGVAGAGTGCRPSA